jgi:hypothetical protein
LAVIQALLDKPEDRVISQPPQPESCAKDLAARALLVAAILVMAGGMEDPQIPTMAGVEQAATPEAVVAQRITAQVGVGQAAVPTVLAMALAAVAVWGLLGKVLQAFTLTKRAVAVLAGKHLQREKTHLGRMVM